MTTQDALCLERAVVEFLKTRARPPRRVDAWVAPADHPSARVDVRRVVGADRVTWDSAWVLRGGSPTAARLSAEFRAVLEREASRYLAGELKGLFLRRLSKEVRYRIQVFDDAGVAVTAEYDDAGGLQLVGPPDASAYFKEADLAEVGASTREQARAISGLIDRCATRRMSKGVDWFEQRLPRTPAVAVAARPSSERVDETFDLRRRVAERVRLFLADLTDLPLAEAREAGRLRHELRGAGEAALRGALTLLAGVHPARDGQRVLVLELQTALELCDTRSRDR